MAGGLGLRSLATLWVVLAMAVGMGCAALWLHSARAWDDHRAAAHAAGLTLYDALRSGSDPGPLIQITPLPPAQAALATAGNFERLTGSPLPAYVTTLSLRGADGGLQIGVVSDALRYPVADLGPQSFSSAPAQLAALTRLFATYCSDPILYARFGTGDWQRVDGLALWGCGAAPRDLRLLAVLLALLTLAALLTHIGNTTQAFDVFSRALRRRTLGGPQSYEATGPAELREIVASVNTFLQAEQRQLANRAAVLSSVSHDLGTPATRLRLRAALIPDAALREKLETDIDRMTGIIESVLTYTRVEMNAEPPRVLSLNSLVETVVADYQDIGKPVSLIPPRDVVVTGGRSVFMSRQGRSLLAPDRPVIVSGRPVALERAMTNLVDNALKYGRRARVGLRADSDFATIVVEDEGAETTAAQIAALVGPYQRGDNSAFVDGHGLGLSIVVTIAALHGGELGFEDTASGLRACLTIRRKS
ncbi:sensor histidine kinase [Tropicibacter oceani]|uniref:histidine kinase n=1 Tax=Tropicibacter oceani TaxID=3058420 RepID=A0ABY8QPP8_9RHOB|nr:HAMP domain-containing sensor histidine kinase [Tropicibacter oceani]WGW06006.1 HAMP domain-containing sensor histidine kinase [Tropicibacter oceani]